MDFSYPKTYQMIYYTTLWHENYFCYELRVHRGGHFEYCSQRPPGVTAILLAVVFEIVGPIPNTMQNFKNLSQSAQLL